MVLLGACMQLWRLAREITAAQASSGEHPAAPNQGDLGTTPAVPLHHHMRASMQRGSRGSLADLTSRVR
jgi:hypothetical protein